MKSLAAFGLAALLPSLSSAHYLFPDLIVNGEISTGYVHVREHDNGFEPSMKEDIVNSDDFRCNKGSENHMDIEPAVVVAGQDEVGFQVSLGQGLFHPGPITIYLSKAPGEVREYDGSGDWFKVYQLGTSDPWDGTDEGWLTWDQSQFTFLLPAEIPAGQYLMRIEQMAVHQPYAGKEFYFQCAHLDIQSDYTGPDPSPTIQFPGGYNGDPALDFDSWVQPPPSYCPMPGPAQWPNGE
ncbi:hypothetical protein FQN54_002630 [Arachnomyces sp. PD_36]|nr:hypothetical protein FQN54_002630 [Arachnomyces sp. PD_36]